jgi:GDP-4-dehydro-6-deoxy-D-mannose reductase
MKVLVTGAGGFTGPYAIREILSQGGVKVGAVFHSRVIDLPPEVQVFKGDLKISDTVLKILRSFSPDAVLHLAGLNKGTFDGLLAENCSLTRELLEAISQVNPQCRVLLVSSSAVYGYPGDEPIPETTPLAPRSLYGVSKVCQEAVGEYYHRTKGVPVAIARTFNLVGPDLPDYLLCGHIVREVMKITQGEKDAINLQEMESRRDYLDVRDAVLAYWSLLSHPEFETECAGDHFNVGFGSAYSVRDIIDIIEEMTQRSYRVSLPKSPPDILIPSQQSDTTKISDLTGWKPGILLEESLFDMICAK